MKKLLALCLTVVLCLCCLASCSTSTLKNEWFSDELLEKCEVPQLPEISDKDYYYSSGQSSYINGLGFNYIEFKATDEEIREYARVVYEYLEAQNFEYLGTRGGQKSSLAGAFATDYFRNTNSFGECYSTYYAEHYIFVYSNDTDTSDGITFNEILITSIDSNTVRYDGKDVSVNAKISIKYDARYDLKESEINYPIGDSITGYWFFHSGIIDGKEVIIYDKYDNGLIVTPTYYSTMIFNDDYTGEYELKGTKKTFTWTTLDDTNVQVEFSDDTIGIVTLVNDERIRLTYGDLTIIYDE